jgi:tRNA G18 (ribose-2'-O)-methylase SpoU
MSPLVAVNDPDDPGMADYLHLTDAVLRRRVEESAFIVEGTLAIDRLLESAYPVRSLLVTAAKADRYAELDAPVYVADQAVMNEVAGFDIHRGALASAARLPLPALDAAIADVRLVVGVEGVNDAENMGALFRNARAFGAGAVVLTDDCCDPLYRRSVRVSLGHALHVPFTRTDSLDRLRHCGFTTVALTPHPDAEPLEAIAASRSDQSDQPDQPERIAILVGAEGEGLRQETQEGADRRVRIPMAGGVDSINVAAATAVALYALSRPR